MKKTKKAPRGIRNNNPLNIRRSKQQTWYGEVNQIVVIEEQSGEKCQTIWHDRQFCQFSDMAYGLRAAAKLLINYQKKHNLHTIREIINRWAPANENNTEGYIKRVTQYSCYTPDYKINLQSKVELTRLVFAMICVECGNEYDPYLDQNIMNAWLVAEGLLEEEGHIR